MGAAKRFLLGIFQLIQYKATSTVTCIDTYATFHAFGDVQISKRAACTGDIDMTLIAARPLASYFIGIEDVDVGVGELSENWGNQPAGDF